MSIMVIHGDKPALLSQYATTIRKKHPDVDVDVLTNVSNLEQALQPSLLCDEPVIFLKAPSAAQIKMLSEEGTSSAHVYIFAPSLNASLKKIADETIALTGKTYKDTGRLLLNDVDFLDARTKQYIIEHMGINSERIPALVDTLRDLYKKDIALENVLPYLGPMGGMKPWFITDAIDEGDAGAALRALDRAIVAGDAVFMLYSIVSSHFERMFRLYSVGITDETQAAQLLGMKGSTYPALKSLRTLKRYRSTLPVLMPMVLKAGADLQGDTGLPPRVVLEVLIGRLANHPRR